MMGSYIAQMSPEPQDRYATSQSIAARWCICSRSMKAHVKRDFTEAASLPDLKAAEHSGPLEVELLPCPTPAQKAGMGKILHSALYLLLYDFGPAGIVEPAPSMRWLHGCYGMHAAAAVPAHGWLAACFASRHAGKCQLEERLFQATAWPKLLAAAYATQYMNNCAQYIDAPLPGGSCMQQDRSMHQHQRRLLRRVRLLLRLVSVGSGPALLHTF